MDNIRPYIGDCGMRRAVGAGEADMVVIPAVLKVLWVWELFWVQFCKLVRRFVRMVGVSCGCFIRFL